MKLERVLPPTVVGQIFILNEQDLPGQEAKTQQKSYN